MEQSKKDKEAIKGYKEAVDELKNSIVGLNGTLPSFTEGLNAGLKGIAEKLPEIISSITKLNIQTKELGANGQKPVSVLKQLGGALFSWNNLISVGATLLASFSGVFIKWIAEAMKGQTTLTALGKAMKDNAIIMDAIIQTRLKGHQAAQKQITDLTALYNITQNQSLKNTQQQTDALKALKEQWPETFGSFKDQEILATKAADAYKNLKNEIMGVAFAEAAKARITANASRSLDDELRKMQEKENNNQKLAAYNKAKKKYDKFQPTFGDESLGALSDQSDKLAEAKKQLDISNKKLADLTTDQKLLEGQNKLLYNEIEKQVKQFGLKAIGFQPKRKTRRFNYQY